MRLQNKCERSENESRRKTTSFSSYSIVIYSLIVSIRKILLLDNNLLGLTIRLDDVNTASSDAVDLGTIDGIDGWLAV